MLNIQSKRDTVYLLIFQVLNVIKLNSNRIMVMEGAPASDGSARPATGAQWLRGRQEGDGACASTTHHPAEEQGLFPQGSLLLLWGHGSVWEMDGK